MQDLRHSLKHLQIRKEDRWCSLKPHCTLQHHWSLADPWRAAELWHTYQVRTYSNCSTAQHEGRRASGIQPVQYADAPNMQKTPPVFIACIFPPVLFSQAATVLWILVWSFQASSFREQNVTVHYFKGPLFNLLPFWSCSAKYKLYVPNIAFTWLNKQTRQMPLSPAPSTLNFSL